LELEPDMSLLKGRDVIRIDQFTREEIELILDRGARMAAALEAGEHLIYMAGKVLATLFYEPSTRTRLSFESAMLRLGGQVVSVAEAKTSSSAAKGETLFDTGKMIEAYSDVAVIRHPIQGSAQELAEGASIPIVNGGDGTGQHPTQALLDVYTILQEKGTLQSLTIALVGDLKNGRTVHSLVPALARFDFRFYFVAPESLRMPAELTKEWRTGGAEIVETEKLGEAAAKSDVLYVTRIQKERFADLSEYERLKGSFLINRSIVENAKPGITIMHPLPRVDEIAREVDAYEGAAYFREAANGVPVRMALLALITGAI
jgi:aspartate carbamoyltransferase catalytic subunit